MARISVNIRISAKRPMEICFRNRHEYENEYEYESVTDIPNMILVDVNELVGCTIIESDRIEFERDWNREKVLHTICAFANDFDNIGGGYIIIGIDEIDGSPANCIGVNPSRIPGIEHELTELCNSISPGYSPNLSVEKYHGKDILVLWVPGGERRPYKCPVTPSKKKSDNVERAYYIRVLSNTVRANRDEEITLVRRASNTPFDDMVNETASVNDIRRGLVTDFLNRINSRVDYGSMENIDLYRLLRIVRGPSENPRPVNVGLMMFSDDPERFFRNAHIEVVYMPDPTGEDMEETVFRGPLDDQIRNALRYISGMFIREKVIKLPDQAESLRFFNYPYKAVEETLVNAVYHRDYEIPEPIKVIVRPDRMEIFNRPGPDKNISDERIEAFDLRSDCYLNNRLGDFLKELKLTEGRSTGIPRVLKSLEDNGSDPPVYETDEDRRFLRVIIPIHSGFLPRVESGSTAPGDAKKNRTSQEIKSLILESLRDNGCQSGRDLAASIGYSSTHNTFRRCVRELMDEGKIEYKYPDNPRDRRQKICLPRQRI